MVAAFPLSDVAQVLRKKRESPMVTREGSDQKIAFLNHFQYCYDLFYFAQFMHYLNIPF